MQSSGHISAIGMRSQSFDLFHHRFFKVSAKVKGDSAILLVSSRHQRHTGIDIIDRDHHKYRVKENQSALQLPYMQYVYRVGLSSHALAQAHNGCNFALLAASTCGTCGTFA